MGKSLEFLSPDFLTALLSIIVIDLVLAGDNAIVIGLAAKNLPKPQQKSVIIWGTAGAILIRILLTLIVAWLLDIPGLRLIGGLLLVWIAFKLLVEEKEHDVEGKSSFWAALSTIVIADTVMSLDNVLAIASAAETASHSNTLLVILGLIISVPIIVWGSTIFIKLIHRFPIILYIGSAVLAYTAAIMITEENLFESFFQTNVLIKYIWVLFVITGVIGMGFFSKQKESN